MDSFKFFLKKDYNQFRSRKVASNSISFKIYDYTLTENEKMYFAIKEKGDIETDEIYIEMKKKDVNEFVVDLPCNKKTTYEFRIFTKFPDSDEIVEQSAINTFKYEGIVFDERKIEETEQWGIVQATLHRLNSLEDDVSNVIIGKIEDSDITDEIRKFIERNQTQVDEIQQEVRTTISQLSTILDEFIDEGDM